jgi:hypothetical protein
MRPRFSPHWTLPCAVSSALVAGVVLAVAGLGQAARPALRVTIEPESAHIPVGVSERFYLRLDYADGRVLYQYEPASLRIVATDRTSNVAAVEPGANLRTFAPGQLQLETDYEGHHATTTVTIFDEPPTEVTLDPHFQTLDRGAHQKFFARAQFASGQRWKEWQVDGGAGWTATDVEPGTRVASIDERGNVRALHAGMTEISAVVGGKRVTTHLMVVEPAADSPRRFSEKERMTPPASYRTCRARIERVWLPLLRRAAGGPVDLKGTVQRRRAELRVSVRGNPADAMEVYWDPDECDAAGPPNTGVYSPDWRNPQTMVDRLLLFAGFDCLEYPHQ